MNKNHVTGTVKTEAGKLEQKAGKATGSTEQRPEGMTTDAEGRMQKAVGAVKEALKNSRHE